MMSTLQATYFPFVDTARYPVDSIIGDLRVVAPGEGSGDKDYDYLSTSDPYSHVKPIPVRAIVPPLEKIKRTFRLIQMWEGRVELVDPEQGVFTAIISDKTNPELPDEEVTLSIEEIPKNDLALLQEGAVFYWSIGYADEPGRPRERASRIRFRRLPKWTDRELNKARERGKKLANIFSSD